MKYIILHGDIPILFPDYYGHKDVAGDKTVVSAGFCQIDTRRNEYGDVRARSIIWGRSDSLNIDSHPKDADIISRIFNQN